MKLAFVVPWYGKGVSGGAESEAYRTMMHLVDAGFTVDVFTTSIQDFFADWSRNHHRPGTTTEDGIRVHRYPVLPRNKSKFDDINQKIIGGIQVSPEEKIAFADEFIKCPALLHALRRERENYLFFFIPYLFPTTFDGVNIVGRNSVIIPCLHDEGYADLEIMRQMMGQAAAIVYHTQSEYRLANQLYALPTTQIQTVLGEGVDAAAAGDGDAFKKKFNIDGPYFLYAGRKGAGKNIPRLLSYWDEFQNSTGNLNNLKLILIGPGKANLYASLNKSVIDLGFVSAEDKRNGFAGATAFINPSMKESFSLVLMDSWQAGRPVLVNGHSPVLVEHVKRSSGGLYYGGQEEFSAMVDWFVDHPEEANVMGMNGKRYVEEHYRWDVIIEKYIALIEEIEIKNSLDIERR